MGFHQKYHYPPSIASVGVAAPPCGWSGAGMVAVAALVRNQLHGRVCAAKFSQKKGLKNDK